MLKRTSERFVSVARRVSLASAMRKVISLTEGSGNRCANNEPHPLQIITSPAASTPAPEAVFLVNPGNKSVKIFPLNSSATNSCISTRTR